MPLKSHRPCAARIETLEQRNLLTSVGWDGPGLGSAELTYYVSTTNSGLADADVRQAIDTALAVWSAVVDIKFTPTTTRNLRDSIDITFAPIDGPNGTLAQAYFPDDVNSARIAGDVQFDSAETWEIGNARGAAAVDLVLVAVHELGHALGLEHSDVPGSVMAPSVSPSARFTALSASDVDAILQLYSPAKLAGDIDRDGDVDGADVAAFVKYFGTTSGSTWSTGDFDGDGSTSLTDLALLQSNLGKSTGSAANSPANALAPAAADAALAEVLNHSGIGARKPASRLGRPGSSELSQPSAWFGAWYEGSSLQAPSGPFGRNVPTQHVQR